MRTCLLLILMQVSDKITDGKLFDGFTQSMLIFFTLMFFVAVAQDLTELSKK